MEVDVGKASVPPRQLNTALIVLGVYKHFGIFGRIQTFARKVGGAGSHNDYHRATLIV